MTQMLRIGGKNLVFCKRNVHHSSLALGFFVCTNHFWVQSQAKLVIEHHTNPKRFQNFNLFFHSNRSFHDKSRSGQRSQIH